MDITSIDEREALIRSVGEEVIESPGQLRWLLENKPDLVAYDGFEPSGNIHIAQGLLRAININKMARAGVRFKMFIADWHAAANNKFGGDLEVIKRVGEFFKEVWRVCDMDLSRVEFVWASDIVQDPAYWELVLKIATKASLNRVMRCTQIMGRSSTDNLQASQIMYPVMQAADIFYLGANICQLGLDQRKVNMLAREVSDAIGMPHKPVAVHHMLMGLTQPPPSEDDVMERAIQNKMSKSNPNSAIFMLDSEQEVNAKIKNAWCPQFQIHDNPVLEYVKYIVFERVSEFVVERKPKFGGDLSFGSYAQLAEAYEAGQVHPLDIKVATAKAINQFLQPIRDHFESNTRARELFEFVQQAKQTR
jgi:tyrosyl-tRNA synthetase